MKYTNIVSGKFISRPNRFIAYVEIDGKIEICHVKNTGRCRELLVENAKVILQKSDNQSRKTPYDLIAVYKGENLINIDSIAPNKVFYEWAKAGNFIEDLTLIKPECKYKNSRFDFYCETKEDKIFIEVKGVTLENNGVLMFPDAPTERGVKHITELIDAVSNGYDAYIFFVIQMKDCLYFTPNEKMHPEFAQALRDAQKMGVKIKCVNCNVTTNSIEIDSFVDVKL